MKRQSDIGWFELIMGLILIILGIVIMRQPVGVLTWIVILCGVIAVISGIGDIVLYVKMERFTGFGPVVSVYPLSMQGMRLLRDTGLSLFPLQPYQNHRSCHNG